MRSRLNCWLVAMWLWAGSCGKQYVWVRRSHLLHGLVPHFGFAESHDGEIFKVIEYIPPHNRRFPRGSDCVLLFPGHYRVTYLRVTAVVRRATLKRATNNKWQTSS